MYGCSIDQRLMLPRPPTPLGAPVEASGLNAVSLDDRAAGQRPPGMLGVLGHFDQPLKRRQEFAAVNVDDVGMRARPVEDRPDGPSERDLDDLVLPRVGSELHVEVPPRPVDEVDALTGRHPQYRWLDGRRRDD